MVSLQSVKLSQGAGKDSRVWLFETNKRTEDTEMDQIRKLYAKADGFARGQTMAEYALILAAVGVVCFAGYQTMGTTVPALLASVDRQLYSPLQPSPSCEQCRASLGSLPHLR